MDVAAIADTTYDADGFMGAQHDAFGEGNAGPAPYEWHHMHGFVSRPMQGVIDPVSGELDSSASAQMQISLDGARGHALPMEDPRLVPLLPQLRRGESAVYGAAWGQFIRLHDDGCISFATTTKSAYDGTGQPVTLWLCPTAIQLDAPWGRLTYDQSGFHVQLASGAGFTLGGLGGIPQPVSALGGTFFGVKAASVSLDAGAVAAGSAAGSQQAVALALPVLECIVGIQAALASIQAALASATPASGITTPQVSAVEAAVAASNVLSVAASLQVPSPSLAG